MPGILSRPVVAKGQRYTGIIIDDLRDQFSYSSDIPTNQLTLDQRLEITHQLADILQPTCVDQPMNVEHTLPYTDVNGEIKRQSEPIGKIKRIWKEGRKLMGEFIVHNKEWIDKINKGERFGLSLQHHQNNKDLNKSYVIECSVVGEGARENTQITGFDIGPYSSKTNDGSDMYQMAVAASKLSSSSHIPSSVVSHYFTIMEDITPAPSPLSTPPVSPPPTEQPTPPAVVVVAEPPKQTIEETKKLRQKLPPKKSGESTEDYVVRLVKKGKVKYLGDGLKDVIKELSKNSQALLAQNKELEQKVTKLTTDMRVVVPSQFEPYTSTVAASKQASQVMSSPGIPQEVTSAVQASTDRLYEKERMSKEVQDMKQEFLDLKKQLLENQNQNKNKKSEQKKKKTRRDVESSDDSSVVTSSEEEDEDTMKTDQDSDDEERRRRRRYDKKKKNSRQEKQQNKTAPPPAAGAPPPPQTQDNSFTIAASRAAASGGFLSESQNRILQQRPEAQRRALACVMAYQQSRFNKDAPVGNHNAAYTGGIRFGAHDYEIDQRVGSMKCGYEGDLPY